MVALGSEAYRWFSGIFDVGATPIVVVAALALPMRGASSGAAAALASSRRAQGVP